MAPVEVTPLCLRCININHVSVAMAMITREPVILVRASIGTSELCYQASHHPVFDCLQYARTEGEGLVPFIM